jgi:hypothetical protein
MDAGVLSVGASFKKPKNKIWVGSLLEAHKQVFDSWLQSPTTTDCIADVSNSLQYRKEWTHDIIEQYPVLE